ncbi:sugar transferase [Actinotalea ferrariae]|uniref:sugar transferase n=1 Tax=Actinotalea ferrariae TaxID=1386098 RepID=UPI001C8B47ED|nr:sugar transferase [Actinotalea ferrariae]MBX9244237.1 sugar transferase [Actinotalea ferrariae]
MPGAVPDLSDVGLTSAAPSVPSPGGGRLDHVPAHRDGVPAPHDGVPAQRDGRAGAVVPVRAGHRRWWVAYSTRVLLTDAVAVYVAVFTAYVVREDAAGIARVSGQLSPTYLAVSVTLMWAWLFALVAGRTQDRRLVGVGPAEYQRVFSVSWRLFAAVAVVAYLGRMEIGRGYLGIAFPLGLALLLAGRYGWRQWLKRRRRVGELQSCVLVVGHRGKAEQTVRELRERSGAGFGVVGVCLPAGEADGGPVDGVPVLGTTDEAAAVARREAVDAVTVVGADSLTSDVVRRLGWDLEGSGIDLALTVAVRDVAGPRVIVNPVNGLPLVYVDEPRFSGPKYLVKTVFDWCGALVLCLLLAPVLVVVAVLVRLSGPGPVLYTQERIGAGGRTFRMLKFRSMVAGAHERLAEVLAAEGVADVGLFYKPKNDPRVTRVGRVLRRFSLDELPQLFNVLRGDMSLVGPRPQIADEVALYDRKAHRRLLVKPGLTGLWQTSGRSGLSPAEGIRMDVYYVENWTLFGDLLILVRTAKAVLAAEGAR